MRSSIVFRWGNAFGLLDRANKRSSHKGVIPKGGGIGILAAFVFASLFLEMPLAFWLSATILALLSLAGDRVDISPKYRLPVQFIAALLFLLLTPHVHFPLTAFFLVFIVATANWYNFMDGINGIAGITGVVAFGLLVAFNILSGGDDRFTVLLLCTAFSCLGFLPFNFPNARVFMGDVGSILLGFVFACFVVILSKSPLEFICLASFIFPFYADEIITMTVRLKDKENLLKPHRRHLYQLLANEMGIDHWKVSAGYGVFQVIVGMSVLFVKQYGLVPVIITIILFFSIFVFVNCFIRKMRESVRRVKAS